MMNKTAFVFPGQGAQYVGMGRDVAERFGPAARIFAEADGALGFKLSDIIFNGDEETLKTTEYTQPALLTVSVALLAAMGYYDGGAQEDESRFPAVAAGLSIGEYAAHVLAGTFGFADAVGIVRLRGRFMQEASPPGAGGMAAILGLDAETVESCCKGVPERAGDASLVVEPANYNCPGQIVISGHMRALDAACALCLERGAKRALRLAVSAPFHCVLLRGAGERLSEELKKITFRKMRIPVVSNATAQFITEAGEAADLLVRQVASPVRWEQSVRNMLARGITRFVEIGPGATLAGFIRKIDKEAEVINVSDAESLRIATERLR